MAKGHLKTTIQHDNGRNKKSHCDPSSNHPCLQPAIMRGCEAVSTFTAGLAGAGLQK
jgi:hypothetical protein